jgi:glycosyltransferase involved in cell wall biosynthesis
MTRADVFVSVVAVLRSYARFLPAFVDDVIRTLETHYTNYELVLVDNGSRDDTPRIVCELLKRHRCVRYLRLSRRMKAETAMVAGLDATIGDFVVTLHPEFDPPAELPAMVELCRSGADVVIGSAPFPTRPGFLYRTLRWGFVKSAWWLLRMDPLRGSTGYRVLSRAAVNALTRVRQRRRFFDLLASDIGFTTAIHAYRFVSRSRKVPRVNLRRSVRTAASMALNHSLAPLRLVSVLGLAGSGLSLAYSLYVVGVYLFKPDVMPGWTTISLQMSGLFFLVFVMLTLIGEHLGRLLDEAIDRPLYHVREEQSSSVMLADLARRNVMDRSV